MEPFIRHLRLPFRRRHWKGSAGNWTGGSVGNSLDFQDHRAYAPGDDPRRIDWRAYARTDAYTMKLFREEISPLVDLVLDTSGSMQLNDEKIRRTRELFGFCEASARRSGASLHCFVMKGMELRHLDPGEDFPENAAADVTGNPVFNSSRVPWRRGSLRIVIADLLFVGEPDIFLAPLWSDQGHGIVFAPFCSAEAAPGWTGNLEMEDCESPRRRLQQVDSRLLRRYEQTYRQHFDFWRESARRRSVILARVPSESDFRAALVAEALPLGAVELT